MTAPDANVAFSFSSEIPPFVGLDAFVEDIDGPVSVRKFDGMACWDVVGHEDRGFTLGEGRQYAVAIPVSGSADACVGGRSRVVDEDVTVPGECRMPQQFLIAGLAGLQWGFLVDLDTWFADLWSIKQWLAW